MSGDFQNVHVRVNDADTNKPTPVRIRFVGADGNYYAPFGRLTDFATDSVIDVGGNLELGGKKYAYIDGACEIRLPVGPIDVEIHKGPEYLPVTERVQLTKGKLALRFTIQRWINMREEGWFSGDVNCYHISPDAALLEAGGEDLAVVNILACAMGVSPSGERPGLISNILSFSGQKPIRDANGRTVVVNTINQHRHLGSLALLNSHRPVFPLEFGSPYGVDDWNLADWCEQCHRKGGLVIGMSCLGDSPIGEELADIILGQIDVLYAFVWASNWFSDWQDLLQCGVRVPLGGGSSKCSNRDLLGDPRTYVQLPPQEFTYKTWIEGVRAGRNFVSSGQIVSFTVNDYAPGAMIDLPAGGGPLRLYATARGLTPFESLEIVKNGEVVGSSRSVRDGALASATINVEIECEESAWFVVHCGIDSETAVTSPIYADVANKPFEPDQQIGKKLMAQLDQMLQWVAHEGKFENDKQRQRMAAIYHDAKAALNKRLQRRGW